MKVEFLKLENRDWAVLPKAATSQSNAFDLFVPNGPFQVLDREFDPTEKLLCDESFQLNPGDTVIVFTGLTWTTDDPSIYGHVLSRSGLASKGVVVNNAPGLIDADYRGEIGVILHNNSKVVHTIKRGMAIAQLQLGVQSPVEHNAVIADKTRGVGGFGSTS